MNAKPMDLHNHSLLTETQMLTHLESASPSGDPVDLAQVQRDLELRAKSLEVVEGPLEPLPRTRISDLGSQALEIVAMQKASASMPIASLPTCTDGPPTRRLQSRESGTPANSGKDGAVAKLTGLEAVRTAWEARDAEAVGNALHRSLKPLLNTFLDCEMDKDWEIVRYRALAPIPSHLAEPLRTALAELMKPCGREVVARAAARYLPATKFREGTRADMLAMIAVYGDELHTFPEDVIVTAFRRWARREKWWPSLAEIIEECSFLHRWRPALERALKA
jgi:hypothetical protein